jgi:selenium donor protein
VVDPDVLVGFATSDDAAVYRLGDRAVVATVDIFTPIVDDPYEFGRIAAANSLSDIYAMGARPLFALSIIGFPTKKLPLTVMQDILRGGGDKAREAGIFIIGGHSIDDNEPKFGLSVLGEVAPDKIVRNSTARVGDALVLTKPIGTGVISQGIKLAKVGAEDTATAIATMGALNREACEAMIEVGVSAATDITGFGLVGHLHEVLHASGVAGWLNAAAVPLLPGARTLVEQGIVPGGSQRNLDWWGRFIAYAPHVDAVTKQLLADAQTSGGLLICVPRDRLALLVEACVKRGVTPAVIGGVAEGQPGQIAVG